MAVAMLFILQQKKSNYLLTKLYNWQISVKKMLDIPAEPEQYSYDVIVTGGGIAGMCAAANRFQIGMQKWH